MNDEEFEAAMQTVENNIYSNLAQELRDHNVAQREALVQATHIIRRVAHQSVTEKQLLPSLISDVRSFLSRQDEIELAEYVASLTPEQRAENERIAAKPEEIARLNAQSDALARVEAERDMAKWNLEQTTRALHHHRERAETAQAQLAEALWHLDGVLNNLPEDLSHRFGGSRSFLARHAQAERTAVTEYIGPHGQELLEHIKAEQKEAQGAQAVDEREAFEKWAKDRSWFDPRPSTKERDDSLFCYEEAITDHNWIAWQARAALATQPASCEPVAHKLVAVQSNGEWQEVRGKWKDGAPIAEMLEGVKEDYLRVELAFSAPPSATQPAAGEPVAWMIDWPDEPELGHYFSESPDELAGSRSRPLFTAAPPAAAHGDEAVRIKLPEFILCSDEMHERGKHAVERAIEDQCFGRWTQFKVYFEAAIEEWLSQQEDAAMRAQGDGEARP